MTDYPVQKLPRSERQDYGRRRYALVAQWRHAGFTWKEIGRRAGCGIPRATQLFAKWEALLIDKQGKTGA